MLDVTTFAAAGQQDWSKAFQDAADYPSREVRRLPPAVGSPYVLSKPVFIDRDDQVWVGEGAAARVYIKHGGPAFQFGVKRPTLSADHWVDLHGVLDASACPSPGFRWGPRTKNDARVSFNCSPLSHGPEGGWPAVKDLTVDLIAKANAGWGTGQYGLCGMSENGKPAPWHWKLADGNKIVVSWVNANGGMASSVSAVGPFTQLMRLSVQLGAGGVVVWKNGTVVLAVPGFGAFWFPHNETSPFGIGAVSNNNYGWGDLFGGPHDTTVCGLEVTARLKYKAAPVGSQQERIDGLPVTDANRCFEIGQPAVLSCLPLKDPSGFLVKAYGTFAPNSTVTSWGYFLPAALDDAAAFNRGGLRDLFVESATPYGQVVSIGQVYDFAVDRCRVKSGMQSVGSFKSSASYLVRMRDCIFDSPSGCHIYADLQSLVMSGMSLDYPGRHSIRARNSNIWASGTYISDSSRTERVVHCVDGGGAAGVYRFDGGMADFELGEGPEAYFWCEHLPDSQNASMTMFSAEDWALAGLRAGGSHVVLKGKGVACVRRLRPKPPASLVVLPDGWTVQ